MKTKSVVSQLLESSESEIRERQYSEMREQARQESKDDTKKDSHYTQHSIDFRAVDHIQATEDAKYRPNQQMRQSSDSEQWRLSSQNLAAQL